MSNLQSFVNKTVTILTSDGRTLTGKLLGHDQTTNLILSETIERIFTSASAGPDDPTQQVEHGLYLIRGDNVAVCGLVDDELDAGIDWSQVRAEPLGGMKHT
ncbi:U4/U6-U5 snRNP complex subunit LSM8 [Maublancomyces gigas]|uniref:LSM2-LSM8 complex subunit LSM8 n=1 Tax=Discina gigas TaxID=1032678 RepID=A0ABR3GTU5_9PEZI